ncbi:MAG: tetratricopeptide repeat protein [Thermodesulfobacteriota bacterium]
MASKRPWLFLVLLLIFGGLIYWGGLRQDPDFWRSPATLYRLAKEAEARGELPQALALAQKAWSRNDKNMEVGTYLGWLYLKTAQPQPALEILRQVYPRDPKAAGALKGQAQALDQLGQRRQALELLKQYLQDQPQDADILYFAAQLASRDSEHRELALSYYQSLYQLERHPEVRRQLVDLLTSLGRFAEAVSLQEEEVAQFPESQEALHHLALLHYWQRDYQAALPIYQRLVEKATEDAALRQEAAQTAEAAQKTDEALQHYLWLYARFQGKKDYALALARLWSQKGNHSETAAVLGPLMADKPDVELRRWYALELLLTGDFAKSRQAYEAAWQAGDTHQETIVNLARLYAQARRFAKAAAMWDEARRRQLIRGDLRWEAALTYSYAQDYQKGVAILETVPRDDPKHPQLLRFLGQLHFYQKHWGQAAHYLQAYLQKHPEDIEARLQLAEALAFKPETRDAALGQYAEILKRHDDVPVRLRRIGLLLESRRWEEARQELQACPQVQEPKLILQQARYYLWLGDLEDALAHYDRFLQVDPRNQEASLEKARVLIYLRRPPEALEVLRRLRVGQTGVPPDRPGNRALLAASIEAHLAQQNWQEALNWALRLYSAQFPEKHRQPRDWPEAWRWTREQKGVKLSPPNPDTNQDGTDLRAWPQTKPEAKLSLAERLWVARALCHAPEAEGLRLAAELMVQNLRENRYDHASLLVLSYLLPRLPRFEELQEMVYRIPGVKAGGPEYVAALAYFDGSLGRHGGKLEYLLQVLKEYRHHKWPDNPGELLALADLALELGQPEAAQGYYRKALKLKPQDRQIARLLRQCQMSRKEWGQALTSLRHQGEGPGKALEMARLYLIRGQYEGVKVAVAQLPPGHPDHLQGILLLVQAQRLARQYPETLKTLEEIAPRLPRETYLMEKARVLEAMGDKAAAALYTEIMQSQPGSQPAIVAEARRARAAGNWAGAYKAYARALEETPQDIELLNELEFIRQQMRPQAASRGFAQARGESRPEELVRPWQFSRFDREPWSRFYQRNWVFPGISFINQLNPLVAAVFWPDLPLVKTLPLLQPEALLFADSNNLHGGVARASAGFWLTKLLPVNLAVEYRQYKQKTQNPDQGLINLGLTRVFNQFAKDSSRLRRLEVSLGAGPLALRDRLKVSGEIIWRRYWQRVDRYISQRGQLTQFVTVPLPPHLVTVDKTASAKQTEKDRRDRLFGSLEVEFPLSSRTDGALRYSRRDLFDQEAHIYPRLYQSVQKLGEARLTALHQVEFRYAHQFRPGLDWRGNVAGAFYSDHNRRLTLYQGLPWQAWRQPRMQLEVTPHFYLAKYSQQRRAYFSPKDYAALGLGFDFHRQIFRLPTLIFQGTVQGVGQHGDWGPALQGLAALEWELFQNFLMDAHFFYFREWVDDYRLRTLGLSLRYIF